ncbi:hypothetical protein IWQ62_000536 [Dispira parvispora]|uniref:Transmembrane protein 198 n=1 Tax=Dispira parvispora TaxID=1520584 RepID=A0A9W8AU88_9FUNG|nr:hypothetical protein IWQ62_000536 [Dispira parvispora]
MLPRRTGSLGHQGLLQIGFVWLCSLLSIVWAQTEQLPRPPLMGDQVVAGIFFLLVGLYYFAFGTRKFHMTLLLNGFLICSMLVYYVCIKVRPAAVDDMPRRVIYMVVAMLLGLVFGAILCLFNLVGLFGIGGVGGFSLSMVLLSLAEDGLIMVNWGRGLFITFFVVAFGILVFAVTLRFLMLSTVITGSYLIILGVDFFTRTGYKEHLTAFTHATPSDFYHPGRAAYVLIAAWILAIPVGLFIQHYSSSRYLEHSIARVPKSTMHV